MIAFFNITTARLQQIGEDASADQRVPSDYIESLVAFLNGHDNSRAVEESFYVLGARHRAAFPRPVLDIINAEVTALFERVRGSA